MIRAQRGISVVLTLLTTACATAAPGVYHGFQTLSPTVYTSWAAERHGPADSSSLDLIVLLRGSPGWHSQGALKGPPRHRAPNGEWEVNIARDDGLKIDFRYDLKAHTLTFKGKKLPLGDANVVLFDSVDSPAGPRFVGTRTIYREFFNPPVKDLPAAPGPGPARKLTPGDQVAMLLGRSQELVSFLQCDAKMPDPRKDGMMKMICGRLFGG